MSENNTINISKEQIASWNVFIAVPCYDSHITEPFFVSLLQTCLYFKQIGLPFTVCTISDSLINRARNNLVAKFMASRDCTHIMFIDSDIQFDNEAILKLLWQDKDVVTASYPIKEIDWEKVKAHSIAGVDSKDLPSLATRNVVHLAKPGQQTIQVDKGALEIYEAGTGFMLIKREVFDKMIKKYKKLKFIDDTGAINGEEKDYTYAFFNSYIDEDGRFLSEDYGFCRYYQKIGGSIWLDPNINLNHFGRMKYIGNMTEYLNSVIQ
jgi:hypothetical protein